VGSIRTARATPTIRYARTPRSRSTISSGVPSNADIVILSITTSLGRGRNSGARAKSGEPCGISGPVSDARCLRCQVFAWRNR
jgi:hypothetical protein